MRSKVFRKLLPCGRHLRDDDLLAASGSQSLEHREADRTAAENQYGVTLLVRREVDSMPANRQWFDKGYSELNQLRTGIDK